MTLRVVLGALLVLMLLTKAALGPVTLGAFLVTSLLVVSAAVAIAVAAAICLSRVDGRVAGHG